MSLYELLLFVHVLAAATWFGAALSSLVLLELGQRSRDTSGIRRFIEFDDRVTPILCVPGSILVLGVGIGLVLEGPWSFRNGWVVAGFALLMAVFATTSSRSLVPEAKSLTRALATAGGDSRDVRAGVRYIRISLWLDVTLLAAAIFVMTTKPF